VAGHCTDHPTDDARPPGNCSTVPSPDAVQQAVKQVRTTIPVLHEESLERFSPVRCATDKVVVHLCIVVQVHHPGSLLGICGRDDTAHTPGIKSGRLDIAFVVLNAQRENVKGISG